MTKLRENEILTAWICQVSRLSALFIGREMSRMGFGPGHYFFLAALYRNEGLTQDELSQRVAVNKSNTSRALANLEKYGLIRRESDTDNHRVKRVYLEPKAHEIKNDFLDIQRNWNAALLSGLSEDEKKTIFSLMMKVSDNAKMFIENQNLLTQAQGEGAFFKMKLTDLMPAEDWMSFEKELFDRFYLNCTVYDTTGTGVTGKPNFCNKLCPQIKANAESLAVICAAGNQNFMAQAKKTRKAVSGECDAGLIKIAVPIFVDGEFLGTAGGCGRLPEEGAPETFMIEKTTGMNEKEIEDLCQGLKPMTDDQIHELVGFIEKRIEQYKNEYNRKDEAA